MNAVRLQQSVREYAQSIGIDKIGFTTAAPFRELKNRLKRQQELGYQSGFEEKDLDKRTEPALLLDQAESIISIAIAYPSKMSNSPKGKKGERRGIFCSGVMGNRLSYSSSGKASAIGGIHFKKCTPCQSQVDGRYGGTGRSCCRRTGGNRLVGKELFNHHTGVRFVCLFR